MNKDISFVKMQATGNDFVLLDLRQSPLEGIDLSKLAMEICDRHYGIGGDGLILALPSDKADYGMRVFNPDGSEAEMCGNGIRCFAKYVYDNSKEKKDVISIETPAGIIVPAVILKNGEAVGAEVDMGEPRLKAAEIPAFVKTSAGKPKPDEKVVDCELEVDGEKIKITAVSMGNPHCVIFIEELNKINIAEIGPKIEGHPQFPQRTNVEFVQLLSDKEIRVHVWERGVGETLACGTGACAAVVAGVLTGKTSRHVLVHLPGGDLDVEWEKEDGHVALRGPAAKVFEGKYYLK